MITLNELRSSFLKFFEGKKHKIVQSSPLIPKNDDSLLFTTAGMVQFKNYFTGAEEPKFKRAVSSQKCVRAGGKHNDLDNVGYTARHHTFFEMLGNFSFGDYFKKDAIAFAWEFLTKTLGLPKDKLLVTIYHTDEEAYNIWKKVAGFHDKKIIRIPTDDNFWSMGDTGPCGPCSEIFYDHGKSIEGGPPGSPDEDGDRFKEIWNIVFMQYEKFADGTQKPLPKPSIDTGIGLERLTAVLQGTHNNYETDIFVKIIENSKNLIGEGDIASHRVVADHLRSTSFLIADGLLPSNEGRGYVLRRIMRRAMRHIHQLGAQDSCMYKLVPTLVNLMGNTYPELKEAESLIMDTLKTEEDRFKATLDKGLKILNKETKDLSKGGVLSGKTAFELYDTYGFPLDLTQDILRKRHISVDTAGFAKEMEKQKERAKKAWAGSGETKVSQLYFDIKEKVGETEFVGYETNTATAKIQALVVDGKEVAEAAKGQEVGIVVDKTPFYGTCGGQIGDSGLMIKSSEEGTIPLPFSIFEITDTLKPLPNLFVHRGKVENGTLKVGDFVNLSINAEKKKKIKANHSAAHLMHFALRKIFGKTLTQKGSHIDEHRLRFDVSCNRAITKEEIKEIEKLVNELIVKNTPVQTEVLKLEEARKRGAVALFGEKYDKKVRTVFMGDTEGKQKDFTHSKKKEYSLEEINQGLQALSKHKKEDHHSIELCGGTHVERTGDIGFFKIIHESAIAAGIRRIEAITGVNALNYIHDQLDTVDELTGVAKVSVENLTEKMKGLIEENKKLKKQMQQEKQNQLSGMSFDEKKVGKIKFVHKILKGVNPKEIKSVILDKQNKKYKEKSVILCICEYDGKTTALLGVTKDLNPGLNASELIKDVVKQLDGKGGGGQAWFAMGGGQNFKKAEKAVKFVEGVCSKV